MVNFPGALQGHKEIENVRGKVTDPEARLSANTNRLAALEGEVRDT
jgi:hypothetical protein